MSPTFGTVWFSLLTDYLSVRVYDHKVVCVVVKMFMGDDWDLGHYRLSSGFH